MRFTKPLLFTTLAIFVATALAPGGTAHDACSFVGGCAYADADHSLSYVCGSDTCYNWWGDGRAYLSGATVAIAGDSTLHGVGNGLTDTDRCVFDGVFTFSCNTSVGHSGDHWPGSNQICVQVKNTVIFSVGNPVIVTHTEFCP